MRFTSTIFANKHIDTMSKTNCLLLKYRKIFVGNLFNKHIFNLFLYWRKFLIMGILNSDVPFYYIRNIYFSLSPKHIYQRFEAILEIDALISFSASASLRFCSHCRKSVKIPLIWTD